MDQDDEAPEDGEGGIPGAGEAQDAGDAGDTAHTADAPEGEDTADTGDAAGAGESAEAGNAPDAAAAGHLGETPDAGSAEDTADTGQTADPGDAAEAGNAGEAADAEDTGDAAGTGSPGASPDAAGPGNAGGAKGPADLGETAEAAGARTVGAAGPAGGRRWRARPRPTAVTAVTAVAVLTLVTIAQSPSAKAGAGADTKPVPHTTAAARNAVLTTPVAMTGAATAPPPTPTPTPTPTTTPPAPTRTATAVDVRRAVARAVTALPGSRTGDFAVGVTALDGGVVATYDSDAGDDFFDTASIVKVDILAALLLDAQHDGRPLTAAQRRLATAMIEWSDNSSALALWRTIGRAPGLNAANRTLGLQRTWGGPGDLWGLTQTTAHDQLTLLRAVFGDDSPLSATSRTYVKGLMRSVTSGQRWGVSAANRGPDSDARGYALKNGWLRRTATGLWDINSIGEVTYRGHRLLISVLSSGQRSQAAGIDLVEDMALAAAKAYTAAGTAG